MKHRKTDVFFFICGLFMLSGEIWKQLTLTFILGGGQYNWWYFPFQLCSIPMYILLIYPWLHQTALKQTLLAFLMCYGLLGGIAVFADTTGLHYPLPALTAFSYGWHILLIVLGISAGTVCLRLLNEHQKKAPLRHFLYSTWLYLACCLTAGILNLSLDRYGTINLFYINPDYRMQQIVFRDLVPLLGNSAVILLYIACTILGAFLLFLLWKRIFLLRFLNFFCNFLYIFSKALATSSPAKYSKSRRQPNYSDFIYKRGLMNQRNQKNQKVHRTPQRRKRPNSRKAMMQKRRKIRRRIILGFFLMCLLAIAGFLFYLYSHPVDLKDKIVSHELMEPFDPWDNVKHLFFASRDDVSVQSDTDVNNMGEYTVTYTCRGKDYTAKVNVVDTTPPELTVHPVTTDLVQEITPEMFVENASDVTDVTVQFKNKADLSTEGTCDVEIAATDTSGNETVKTATLTRTKDTTAPVVQGTDEAEVLQGRSMDFEEGVTVTDDLDPEPKFTVDDSKVDFTVPGTYEVIYTTTDRSGNTGTTIRTVKVKKDESYDRKVVYLTFDDGPSENTEKILDILKKYNAKGTFFVTGNNKKYNDSLKRIVKEGSAVALHTYTHDYAKVYASEEAYFDDLQKIFDMVKDVTGVESKVIRFPGGSSNTVSKKYCPGLMTKLTKAVQEKGFQYFDWNCDSTDASGNHVAVDKLVSNATSSSAQHINILMHDTAAKDTTVKALPKIIEHYKSQGYTFEALTVDSYPVHHSVNN